MTSLRLIKQYKNINMSNFNAVLARNASNVEKSSMYSHSVAFSHYNNLSAQLPIDAKTGKLVDGGIEEQTKQCFNNIKAIVDSINHDMSDIVRISIFIKNMKDLNRVNEICKSYFIYALPAVTIVGVDALEMSALIQVEALLSNGEGTILNAPQAGDLNKLINNTSKAPIDGLSSQSVAFSHYNNLSAQLPIDPLLNRLVEGGIKEQTKQCLKNIKAILNSIDVPFDDIVKTTIFLKDLADMEVVDMVYKTYFPDSAIARAVAYFPARTIVGANALPMNALIQIEAVVSHGDGTPPQEVEDRHGLIIEANNTKKAPLCALSAQSVAFSHYNNLSAQLPIDPLTNELILGGIKEQTAQCLENIKTIVSSVDHVMEDIVKVNIYLEDIDDVTKVDEVYRTFFPQGTPARRIVGISTLPKRALIQIEVIVANAEGTPPFVK